MSKSREDIITSMCYTYRHDYGLIREAKISPTDGGMTPSQRELLWRQMAQLFDNDISPYMDFKKE